MNPSGRRTQCTHARRDALLIPPVTHKHINQSYRLISSLVLPEFAARAARRVHYLLTN